MHSVIVSGDAGEERQDDGTDRRPRRRAGPSSASQEGRGSKCIFSTTIFVLP